jgi:hypothetical protein
VRIGKAPAERAPNPDRKSALELALRSYVDRKEGVVVDQVVGSSFDSLEEAYEFYNLYELNICSHLMCCLVPWACVQILVLKFNPDFKQKWNENTQCWNKFVMWVKM